MGLLSYFKRDKVSTKAAYVRGFNAALQSRLTSGWRPINTALDWDLRTQLPVLRARSRDLSQNDPWVRRFLSMVSSNVVGPQGFNLQVQSFDYSSDGTKRYDRMANETIEAEFWKWAKPSTCTVTGKDSFNSFLSLYVKALARDGEVLVRKIKGPSAGNKYNFALQLLDIDRLDENKNEVLGNGNIIKMGVELNSYGRPVAYHIKTAHPGEIVQSTNVGFVYERIPAEDCYHHFIADRPEQNRGVPWLHAAMLRLNNLGGYEEAAVIAARVGASQMGFYTQDGDEGGEALADAEGPDGELIQEAEPGIFGVLPKGMGFQKFDPNYPHQQFADFVKANLRGVASGINVSYNSLANDLEGVNFSSIRSGVLEERDAWMVIQNWVIEQLLDDLFAEWLRWSLLSRAILLPNGSALPTAKFDKFNMATWRGRRWAWVDPRADMDAAERAVANGFKTRSQICAEQGTDFEDVVAGLAAENEKLREAGITLGGAQAAPVVDEQMPTDGQLEPAADATQSKPKQAPAKTEQTKPAPAKAEQDKPAAEPAPAPQTNPSAVGMNGAQVEALQAIVAAVSAGTLEPDVAAVMIEVAFPFVTSEQAQALVGSKGVA